MTHSSFSTRRALWRNGEIRFSLIRTNLFWGVSVTPRFLLAIWVPVALGTTNNAMPTYLDAMVAVGTVLGAGAATKLVTLETVLRRIPAGILVGTAVMVFAIQQSLLPAFSLLLLLGVFGGFFIIPLNASLQERGKHPAGAGDAVVVQNLDENMAMLLMLGLYSLAMSVSVSPVAVGIRFGMVFAVTIVALWIWERRK